MPSPNQYRSISFPYCRTLAEVTSESNKLYAEGWRTVQVHWSPKGFDLFLERLPAPPDPTVA